MPLFYYGSLLLFIFLLFLLEARHSEELHPLTSSHRIKLEDSIGLYVSPEDMTVEQLG
jgi:hypothetical protein